MPYTPRSVLYSTYIFNSQSNWYSATLLLYSIKPTDLLGPRSWLWPLSTAQYITNSKKKKNPASKPFKCWGCLLSEAAPQCFAEGDLHQYPDMVWNGCKPGNDPSLPSLRNHTSHERANRSTIKCVSRFLGHIHRHHRLSMAIEDKFHPPQSLVPDPQMNPPTFENAFPVALIVLTSVFTAVDILLIVQNNLWSPESPSHTYYLQPPTWSPTSIPHLLRPTSSNLLDR